MPDRTSKPRRPRDINQVAHTIVREPVREEADKEEQSQPDVPEKNPHAQALGRLGGKKGGPARAAKLSAERKREIAKKAAEVRWQGKQR